ncbi:MAG: zeta toxin family protein [Specibacter sp.]
MPVLHLLAGPNGAGKSSYVRDVLAPATHLPFINADEIAASRWPDAQVEHAYKAAQIAETLRRDRIAAGESFISETVFSHPSKVQLVADAADAGYLVHLYVIMVPVELTVQRVHERVRRGGHAVPERKTRDRYQRLWEHIGSAIRIADVTEVFDNSRARTPFQLCATYQHGTLIGTPSWPKWAPVELSASTTWP